MKKITILLTFIFLNSCSLFYNTYKYQDNSKSKLSPKKSIYYINKKLNSIDYFQLKAKVTYTDNQKKKSNTITLRGSSYDKLWLNASLGAARVLIQKDSIKYYNKLEKNFFETDFHYLNKKIGVEFTFKNLQNLLLGILSQKFNSSSLFKKTESSYVFKEDNYSLGPQSFQSTLHLNPYNATIIYQSFYSDNNIFEVFYDDYIFIQNQFVPTKIKFINDGIEVLLIEIKSFTPLEKIHLPFRIPNNFKQIDL
tara:strand:- start:2225 stop:2980 length:756 start_codon:yes stop_codon:yes gene_type:complete